ncbi:MAG TPA: hypothetical protein VHL58_12860 [Thermoanaerobaculia bacterium]|nr:hypothetical protein [Thermoanaerobaculia bacterium]
MPQSPTQLQAILSAGKLPTLILIGGDNEFLVDRAFTAAREQIVEAHPDIHVQRFDETADLSSILDSFRTYSLFATRRLLVVPEVNAFVTRKELLPLYEKSIADWTSAKTDRKRASSIAKLLHLLGLVGMDVDATETTLGSLLGLKKVEPALSEMLEVARSQGKKASRGEGDSALLAEAISQGGAPGTVLMMKTGEVPRDSATVALIESHGVVVICDLTREEVPRALEQIIASVGTEYGAKFDAAASRSLMTRLGIDRVLADKFSREVPDLRLFVSEVERLATFAGQGGRVSSAMIEEQVIALGGGARYEFASLFAERKTVQAVSKLRDLIAQARREDPKTPLDVQYGKFLFPLADEIRQLLGIHSFARRRGINLNQSMSYNTFKDRMADALSAYLAENRLVKQKPHPFALHKRFEAARSHREGELLRALADIAELDFARKSGGMAVDVGLETLVLRT